MLENIMERFNIRDKVFVVTTDNASNIVASINSLENINLVRCFAHSVQLVIISIYFLFCNYIFIIGAIKDDDLISKCRSVVKLIRNKKWLNDLFKQFQDRNNVIDLATEVELQESDRINTEESAQDKEKAVELDNEYEFIQPLKKLQPLNLIQV